MSTNEGDSPDPAKLGGVDATPWAKRFIAQLRKQVPNVPGSCPSCGRNSIGIDINMWTPLQYVAGGGPTFSGKSYPTGILTCGTCGFVRQYNLIILGVVDREGNLRDD